MIFGILQRRLPFMRGLGRFHLVLLWVAAGLAATAADARTLKIATVATDGSVWMGVIRKAAKSIEAETEGRVKFKFFGGASMGNDQQVLRRISIGQLQGAALTAGVLEDIYQDVQLYSLPLVFRDYAEVDYIRKRMDAPIRAGLEEAGFVNFGFAEGGFAYAMTKNLVTSVEGVRAQKVWVPSNDDSALLAVNAYGITPIPLGLSDVLLALQTGSVNAVAGPAIAAIALQWHTQIKHLLDLPLIYTYGLMVVTDKAFARIQPADQAIVRKHMQEAFTILDGFNRRDEMQAREALRGQGIGFQSPSPEELEQWQSLALVSVRAIVDEGLVSRDLHEQMQGHLRTYRGRVPQ